MYTYILISYQILLSLYSIAFETTANNNQCTIFVARTYKGLPCGKPVTTFDTFDGSEFLIVSGKYDSKEVYNKLMTTTTEGHSTEKSRTNITNSNKRPYAVVIQYEKEMSGYGCKIKRSAVGYGNNFQEAEQNAVKEASFPKNTSYTIERKISCN